VENAVVTAAGTGNQFRTREADLKNSLENPQGGQEQMESSQEQTNEEDKKVGAVGEDYQLNQALNLLKGLQIISHR